MLTGPDVSHHQGVVDMRQVKAAGHAFVGIKATEGTGYTDPLFAANRQHARDAGLVRLLYHFARPGSQDLADARAEARYFADRIGQLEAGEIAVLDIEDPNAPAGRDLGPWALAWLAEVDAATGRAGGPQGDEAEVYTYGPYATAHLRLAGALAGRPLWLAAYSSRTPTAPRPWDHWTFWQYTSSGACPGITGRCDLNRFTGPLDALNHLAGIWPAAPTTPQEAVRMGYTIAEIVRGFAGAWPNGRWTFYAVTPEGRVDVLNDVSQLGGNPSAFHWGDTRATHLNAPVVGFEQLEDDKGHATGYVLLAADGGTFQFGTGVPA